MYDNYIITISIALASIAFLILVIFLVIALVSLTKSLKRTEKLIENSNDIAKNLSQKLHTFDSFFNQFTKANRIVEKKGESPLNLSEELLEGVDEEKRGERAEVAASILGFIEWGLVGLALIMKTRKNK